MTTEDAGTFPAQQEHAGPLRGPVVVAVEPSIPPEPDMPDDLGRGHRPPTSTSTPLVTHTRPATCDFTMHTTHCLVRRLASQCR